MKDITPKISIISPVYNAERYIVKCLDSILVQTFQDWELILVDDGSSVTNMRQGIHESSLSIRKTEASVRLVRQAWMP